MNRLKRALSTGGAAVTLTMVVAGCGGGTVADPGANNEQAEAATSSLSVETARGAVKLDKAATKVVSLEYSYTEELLALGVTPVGVADSEGYATWVSAKGSELPTDITDVGLRQEPSIEKIKSLKPDLIVSDDSRLTENFDQLNDIAPVLAFDPTSKPQLDTMKKNFTELAEAVGKQDKAADVLGQLDTKVEEVTGKLSDAGKAGQTFALGQGFTVEKVPSIRMFTGESFAAEVIESTGLKNGWTGKPDDWGMTTVGVEGLTMVAGDATFLYVATEADNPFTGALAKNKVWNGLEFVKKDKAIGLDPGTWLFGGPLSAMQIVDETAKSLGV